MIGVVGAKKVCKCVKNPRPLKTPLSLNNPRRFKNFTNVGDDNCRNEHGY